MQNKYNVHLFRDQQTAKKESFFVEFIDSKTLRRIKIMTDSDLQLLNEFKTNQRSTIIKSK